MPTFTIEQPSARMVANAEPHGPRDIPIDPRASRHVVPNFTALAQPMREQVERHFGTPYKHGAEHNVWDYWYVPGTYTYLRTNPAKVIEQKLVEQFVAQLTEFTTTRLGIDEVTWPFLGMYIENCGQQMHNDARNGSMGYVFSLTRWDERKFTGGETMVFHEQDYWINGRFTENGAATSFYDLVPARFNQLLLFDDRLPHRVPTVRGVSDPCGARLVLHGHVTARRIVVRGPLEQHTQSARMQQLGERVQQTAKEYKGRLHGFVTFAMQVGGDGAVRNVRVLVNRVLRLPPGNVDPAAIITRFSEQLSTLHFDAADGESTVTVPLVFSV